MQLQRSIDRGMFYVLADKIGSDGLPFTHRVCVPRWFCYERLLVLTDSGRRGPRKRNRRPLELL